MELIEGPFALYVLRFSDPHFREKYALVASKASEVRGLKLLLVGQFDFLEWSSDHLRHPHFVAFRDDKNPTQVARIALG
jgi:hypothetical protein